MRIEDLPSCGHADLFLVDQRAATEFNNHLIASIADDLDLGFDDLEIRGWRFRQLDDKTIVASHPAGGDWLWRNGKWKQK